MRPADELRGAAAPLWVLSPPFLHVSHPVSTPSPLARGHPGCLAPSTRTQAVVQHHPWGGSYALAPADEGGHHGHFPKAAVDAAHQAVVPSGPLSWVAQPRAVFLKGPEPLMDTLAPHREGGASGGLWREVLLGSGVGEESPGRCFCGHRGGVRRGPMGQGLLSCGWRSCQLVGSVRPPPHHSGHVLPERSAQNSKG